jgi:hypothetical protein
MAKKVKLRRLEDVTDELERVYNEALDDPDGNRSELARLLRDAAVVLKDTALEAKLDALEELVKARLANVMPLKRVV